jgi:hypothetical protein
VTICGGALWDVQGGRYKPYQRRWTVRLRGVLLGIVLGYTHKAACLRAIQRFKVPPADRQELVVERERRSMPNVTE